MTQFEAWTIVISAVSAVATFAAVIVALWLGVWQSRKQYKRNIVIGFRNNANIEINGKMTPCFEIMVYNVGNTVCAIEHLLLNKYFSIIVERPTQLFFEPQMIGIGETVTFTCQRDSFMDAVKEYAKRKGVKQTTQLVINALDITGKYFAYKTRNTVGEYLAWDKNPNDPSVSLIPKLP